jgi:predicted dehydrogenase
MKQIEKKIMRIGIIGCGGVAESHAHGYSENSECKIVQVFDLNSNSAKVFAEKTQSRPVESIQDMINSREVDAVSICTPPVAHFDNCRPFLEAGIPVLCEKPLELNAARATELAELAEKSGTLFMIGFTHRFHAPVREALKIVKSGAIGRPIYFRNAFGGYVCRSGDHRSNPAISGGGCLIDTSCHSVDLFRLFMGEVKTIHAKVDNIVQKTPVEDIGFISIVGQNGSHGHIMSTNSLPVVRNMFEIHGTEATLTVNYYIPRRPDLTIQNKNEETERAIEVSGPFKFTAMISHFLDCIKNDTPPESTVHDGLQSSRIIEAAYQSSKTNKAIEINS